MKRNSHFSPFSSRSFSQPPASRSSWQASKRRREFSLRREKVHIFNPFKNKSRFSHWRCGYRDAALGTESSSGCSPSLRCPVRDTEAGESFLLLTQFESNRVIPRDSASPHEKAQKVNLGQKSIKNVPLGQPEKYYSCYSPGWGKQGVPGG